MTDVKIHTNPVDPEEHFWVIQDIRTGNFFRGLRGQVLFNTKSAATNSFNEAATKHKYQSGKGLFQSQSEWVHAMVKITPVQDAY